MIEKIYFDDTTFIWKCKLNLVRNKSKLLKESYELIKSMPENNTDGYGYTQVWNNDINFIGDVNIKNEIDKIMQNGINYCKELFNEYNTTYNKINTDVWVNIVRSKNPIQIHFKHNDLKGIDKYHTHTEINKNNKKFYPHYTYVYYIQMPDIMEGEDGVLYFKGQNDNEYWIRPEEDDLIIMPGFMPHAPNNAPKSTVDRIVIAGNVGFEYIKKEKSVL
jgi:hypothetical protein